MERAVIRERGGSRDGRVKVERYVLVGNVGLEQRNIQ